MHTAYTRVERDQLGRFTFHFDAVGRAQLSGLWGLIASTQDPMWVWERLAWTSMFHAKPHEGAKIFEALTEHMNLRRRQRAIEAWAEVRARRGEDVGDVKETLAMFDRTMRSRGAA